MDVEEAIKTRHACRAYLPKEVDLDLVKHILDVSRHCASNCNSQPWKVYVLTRSKKKELSDAVKFYYVEHKDLAIPIQYEYLSKKWVPPYSTRRFQIGQLMYDTLDIDYDDQEGRIQQYLKNFDFFDAPVGFIFTIHSSLRCGSYIDYGLFLQNINLCAIKHSLRTCPIGFFTEVPEPVMKTLQLPDTEYILCGMALGYPDDSAPVNQFRAPKDSIEKFTQFLS